jgi:hypothetical protein
MESFIHNLNWGTIPDWVMIIVTIFTAYFLYQTLKSQKDVQETQTKLFDIEKVRFRESIKPQLKYNLSNESYMPLQMNQKSLTIEITNETNSIALEMILDSENTDYNPLETRGDFSTKRNSLIKGDQPILIHFSTDNFDFVNFNIIYKDIVGTKWCLQEQFQ